VKGAYKKRDRRYATRRSGESHAVKRRDHRRNRRLVVVALLVCALLALVVVDYLSHGVEILQGSLMDETTAGR
jgi:predicted nucleic acid-binding Zn ribbon protein